MGHETRGNGVLMNRTKPETRRYSETFIFSHAFDMGMNEQHYVATVGFYPDNTTPCEVFLNNAKISTAADAYARDSAIALSFALQYGASVKVLRDAMTRNKSGGPMSPLGKLLDILEPQVNVVAIDS